MRNTLALWSAVALLTMPYAVAHAQQGPDFLAPQQAVKVVMDGRPWSATTPEGRQMQVTFNADGTASMKGPMPFPLSASWTIKGQDICLSVSIAGTKCLRFRQVAGGYEGWVGGKPDLTLRR